MNKTLIIMLYLAWLSFVSIQAQTVYRVPSEYPTIQAAVDQARSIQDVVLIAPGLYTGEGNRDIVIDGEDVTIVGDGNPEDIIIDAGGSEGDVHNVFTVYGYMNFYVSLRNLTLQGSWGKSCLKIIDAHLLINNCIISNNYNSIAGSAVLLNEGTLRCVDSIFEDNHARFWGGAIYSEGSVNLSKCMFIRNYAGSVGGAINSVFLTSIDCCGFYENESQWDAGAVGCGLEAYIENSEFNNNVAQRHGGGVQIYLGNYMEMHNCRFADNKGLIGGGFNLYNWIEAKITNCEFVNNTADFCGGGAYIGGIFWTEFTNNTISGNTSNVEGGGLCLETTHEINIVNSIIHGNEAPIGTDLLMKDYENTEWDADAYISYSVVDPAKTFVEGENHRLHFNEGIISTNPEFEDSQSDNYQLSRRSPCIDNGTVENITDFDCLGQPRRVGASVDIGAYEFQFSMQQGVNLFMDEIHPTSGDVFSLESVCVTDHWTDVVELAVMLDINGNYYFYPDWEEPFSSVVSTLEYGRKWHQILAFTWPDGIGSGSGLAFWSVLLNPEDHSVIGDPDVIHWSYY